MDLDIFSKQLNRKGSNLRYFLYYLFYTLCCYCDNIMGRRTKSFYTEGGEGRLTFLGGAWGMTPRAQGKRTGQLGLWDQLLPSFSENSVLWSVSCAGFCSMEFSSSPCHSVFHHLHSVKPVSYPCWFLPWGFGWSCSLPGQPLPPSSIYISYLQGGKNQPLSKILSKYLSCFTLGCLRADLNDLNTTNAHLFISYLKIIFLLLRGYVWCCQNSLQAPLGWGCSLYYFCPLHYYY